MKRGKSKRKHTVGEPSMPAESLKNYIESNHKLITTIGVFIASAVFAGNLETKTLGIPLSALFLSLSLVTSIELYIKTKNRNPEPLLVVFKYFLAITLLLYIEYWIILLYRVFGDTATYLFLTVVSGSFVVLVASPIIKVTILRNRDREWAKEAKEKYYLPGFIVFITIVSVLIKWCFPFATELLKYLSTILH